MARNQEAWVRAGKGQEGQETRSKSCVRRLSYALPFCKFGDRDWDLAQWEFNGTGPISSMDKCMRAGKIMSTGGHSDDGESVGCGSLRKLR